MATQHQAANRIMGLQRRIGSMLTPGLKRTREDQQAGPLSSVFTRFGGGKYRLAARKMRVLEESKISHLRPIALKNFSRGFPTKYQDVKRLIHFKPGSFRQSSIWSAIERVLPTQAGRSPEMPSQPGELRPGSIIQKIPMAPQPGQSIESFREQLQQLAPARPRQMPPQKPHLDPGSRLFSRVQEISGPEPPSEDITPPEPGRGPEPPDQVSKPTTLQRDAIDHREESLPRQEAGGTPSEPVADLPTRPVDRQDIEPAEAVGPSTDADIQEPAELPEAREMPPAETRPALTARPARAARQEGMERRVLPKARPAPRAETVRPSAAHRAISPTPASVPAVQRQPETAARTPTVKKKPSPLVREQAGTPQRPTTRLPRAVDSGLQAEPRTPGFPERPIEGRELVQGPPPQPETPRTPTTEPEREKEPPAVPHRQPSTEAGSIPGEGEVQFEPPPEMPLAKVIESRVQNGKTIQALEPERVISRHKPSLAPKIEVLPDLAAKYRLERRPESEPTGRTAIKPAEFEASIHPKAAWERPDLGLGISPPSPEKRTTMSAPASHAPLPMSLAQMAQAEPRSAKFQQPLQSTPTKTAPQVIGAQQQIVSETAHQIRSQEPALQLPQIQRLPDEPAAAPPVETVRRVDEPETAEEVEPAIIDLNQLAEDVLPYVKRILEIEAERLSNRFR